MVSTRPPNSWRPHSLRTRFVAIILLALVPGFAIILLLILFGGARETRLEAARSAVGTYGRLIAQLHEQTLDESAGILVSLSLHPAVKDQDRVRCDAMLARALRRMAGFSVLLVLAPNGDVVCSSTPVDEPTNLAFRTDFKRAMETKQFSIGDYMVGRVSRQAVLPIAYPALSETGHVRFLVVAGKRLDRLDQRIARLGLPAGTEVRVLDQNGALLARLPERNRDLGRPISNPAVAKEVAGRDHGVFEAVAEDGRRRIYGFRRVNTAGSDITVIASVPRAQALAAVKSINKVFFFGALLSGSVFMLIMWLLSSRMIFRPLGQLITAIRRLRTGDLGARTGVANPIGELDEVALAFDDMAVAIQEREARLAGVMDNIADGVVTIDEAGVIESVNQRIEEMFGYEPDELIGRNMKSLMPEPYRSEHEAHFRRYIECGAPERLGLGPKDLVGERKDRSSFPISLALSEMTLGERRLFIGTLHDITHRRANEAQLLHAQKMDAIGQLTGGVAHDFNNLLTVVTGNLQLLNRTLDEPDRRKKWVETALHASSRGAELTNRLLAFSRRQVLDPRVLNVNELVAGTDSLLCRTLGESIETETVLGAGLWHTEIDPGQLETALLNLAINARDAMPDGGKLTIETRNAHLDDDYARKHSEVNAGQYVLLAVTDTGSGMTKEQVSRAFEPFYTTKGIGKGSGLGLSMIHGFIKQSGGHVKVYSEPNVGTTVKMYLPRALELPADAHAEPTEDLSELPEGREVVLVVEDEEAVRETAVTILESLGYQVLQADDGPTALTIAKERSDIELLFTDVVMPGGMKGTVLAQCAREILPNIKVLYTSGYTENAIVHNGRLDKGAEWLGKPYRDSDLARKIRQVLDK